MRWLIRNPTLSETFAMGVLVLEKEQAAKACNAMLGALL